MPFARPLPPLLLLLLLSVCLVPQPACGYRAYVSISRVQNAWWKGIVAAFGGECAASCDPDAPTNCPKTCDGETYGGVPYTVVWHQNLVQEKQWLDQLDSTTADPNEVLLFSKYCSPNG